MAARRSRRSPGRPRVPVVSDDVLVEAGRMFRDHGYHRTRMQDIAESFGVSHAALYYHFESKQDILAQLSLRSIEHLSATAREITSRPISPGEQLLAILTAHADYLVGSAAYVATLVEHEMEIPADQFEVIQRLRHEYIQTLEGLYREGSRKGELPELDPGVATNLLLGACNWIGRWSEPAQSMSPDVMVAQTSTFLGRILSPGTWTKGRPAATA